MKFLILGDVGLDHTIYTMSGKLSQEAPVPIAKILKEEYSLGLGANVANNLTSFKVEPTLISIVANDEILVDLLKNRKIKNKIIRGGPGRTTVKRRILCNDKQVIRIDEESILPIGAINALQKQIELNIFHHNVIIFSDYGKGFLANIEPLIHECVDKKKLSFVDPKGQNFIKYSNCTLLKPNLKEFEQVYGMCNSENMLMQKMESCKDKLNINNLLVTLGSKGMILLAQDNEFYTTQHSSSIPIVDVQGAGDTVLASIAYFMTKNLYSYQESINLASACANIVVRKSGTSILAYKDLELLPEGWEKEQLKKWLIKEKL